MNTKFTSVNTSEAVLVCGGIDSTVKKVVYYIGYAVGYLFSWLSRIFTKQA